MVRFACGAAFAWRAAGILPLETCLKEPIPGSFFCLDPEPENRLRQDWRDLRSIVPRPHAVAMPRCAVSR